MKPRILINVAFFALLGVVLSAWAIGTLIHLDAVDRPFHVTADFADSPGLHPDLEVTHLGVRVGKVGTVRLRTGKVDVRLDLQRGVKVPGNVEAQVLRKSAIGEPYIELTLPKAGAATTVLASGDHIPLGRTATTVQYKQLFDGLGRTLRAVDPADARTIVHELATGLDGRGDSIHDLVGDAHQLTGTLAANSGLLDELSTELTRLTHTVAGRRTELASGINDLAVFTASMRESRKDLEIVLNGGPGLMRQTHGLLQASRPGIGCLLNAAATPSVPLFTRETSQRATRLLQQLPTFQALADDIIVRAPEGTFVRSTALLTIAGPAQAAAEYARPTAKPAPVTPPQCTVGGGTAKAGKQGAPAAGTAPGQGTTKGADRTGGDTDLRNVSADGPPGRPLSDRLLPMLPVLLAAAVLLGAGANALRALRRRNG